MTENHFVPFSNVVNDPKSLHRSVSLRGDQKNLKVARKRPAMKEELADNVVDAAFKPIKKNVATFLIWRVENMHLAALPKENYGTFYEGDSYLIYAASEIGKSAGPKMKIHEVRGRLEMHIHFWLGSETSKDESTIAAYKSVELDNYLCGAPAQHREMQGKESPRFKGYFKNGIRLLKGGVASALHHVTNSYEPKLYRVKGRRSPTVTQMPSISWEHFNSGDVFILDTKDVIFLWVGKSANNVEKLQAAKVALQMRDEHRALSVVFVDDGKEMDLTSAEKTLFGVYLDPKVRRGFKNQIKENGAVPSQSVKMMDNLKLYKCSDERGTYRVTEVKTGFLLQSDLDSNHSFVVDKAGCAIWVWVGRNASNKERIEAIRNAHGFVKKKNYPSHIPVSRVIEGGEPVEFKSLFKSWRDFDHANGNNLIYTGKLGKVTPAKLDAETLHNVPKIAADSQLMDDGSGKMSIWRLKNNDLFEVPYAMYGRFYSGGCYLIHYKYAYGNKEHHAIYYWMGSNSNAHEQGCLVQQAIAKDDNDANGMAVRVRLYQGKESPHFLAIFHGRMMLFMGEHRDSIPSVFLLRVQGSRQHNSKGVQVPVKAAFLDSSRVFVLRVSDKMGYVWCGRASTGDEREIAKNIANKLGVDDISVIFEGQEKDEFWKSIGGYSEYKSDKKTSDNGDESMPARLFHCTTHGGLFNAEEIANYSQQDLISEDVLLVDTRDAIYVWMGTDCCREERNHCMDTVSDYLKSDPSGREFDIPVIVVKQGHEPASFIGFFASWDYDSTKRQKSFYEVRTEVERQNPILQVELKVSNGIYDFDACEKFPLEKLSVKNPEKLPDGVDPTLKELHLSSNDFIRLFGMKYQDFAQLPQWKKDNLKKTAGLF